MCMANAYVKQNSHERLIVEEIASLRIEGDKLHLKPLFGEEKCIQGRITEIDFMSSRIVIEQKPGEDRKRE